LPTRAAHIKGFIVAQLLGALCGAAFAMWLLHQPRETLERMNSASRLA
jgi:glycerol uptake facilitator-like aquaporin